MSKKLNSTLTVGRLYVLKHVRDNPGYSANGWGTCIADCWKLGWIDAAKNDQGQMIGHQITDAGTAILSAHELSQIRKPQPITPEQPA